MKQINLLLVFVLVSCGARKVEKQTAIEKTSLDVKQTASYDITAETIKNVAITASAYEWSAEPINPDKPMEFTAPDGKTYHGKNTKLTGKKKQETSNIAEESKTKVAGNIKQNIQQDRYGKYKDTHIERKADYSFIWVLIILFFIWLISRIKKRA